MKNTKCLFDEDGQTPEGMVSVSQLQVFMSCPKKWEYGYVEKLAPRVDRPYLGIGKLCHKGMESAMRYIWEQTQQGVQIDYECALKTGCASVMDEWSRYVRSTPFLEEEMPEQNQLLEDALSVFEQAFWEFEPQKYDILTLYQEGKPIPALEFHFVVPCAGSKGLHGYIDAIIKDRETGHVWCTDYKFRKSLSPDEEETLNIQNAVYTWACYKMGIQITGTMTWQHCNTPASDPAILKNGSISRSKIKTTWEHYAAFCTKHGANPAMYEAEMKEKLSDIEWYRSTFEYRNMETVKNMWNQVIIPATYAVKAAKNRKNRRHLYPWNCKMCQFKDLCQAELRNHDANFLRQAEYMKKGARNAEN